MNYFRALVFLLICSIQLVGCGDSKVVANKIFPSPWWVSIKPIIINGDEFYGRPCSVTRIYHDAGVNSAKKIFDVPSRIFTYCTKRKPGKNYLEYDGVYIILHVDRQTAGAGSRTGERYRSADFRSWEEYIGVTWVNGEEYEAWRRLGSTSSKADSRKKVVQE